jgi:hypothetical protein
MHQWFAGGESADGEWVWKLRAPGLNATCDVPPRGKSDLLFGGTLGHAQAPGELDAHGATPSGKQTVTGLTVKDGFVDNQTKENQEGNGNLEIGQKFTSTVFEVDLAGAAAAAKTHREMQLSGLDGRLWVTTAHPLSSLHSPTEVPLGPFHGAAAYEAVGHSSVMAEQSLVRPIKGFPCKLRSPKIADERCTTGISRAASKRLQPPVRPVTLSRKGGFRPVLVDDGDRALRMGVGLTKLGVCNRAK